MQAILDILDPAGANDVFRIVRIGLPEGCLIHPIGLVAHAVREPEGLKHFHRTAGHAVGLSFFHRAGLLLDQDGLYVVKPCELRRQRQAGGAAADDEDVGLCGKREIRPSALPCRDESPRRRHETRSNETASKPCRIAISNSSR